MAEKRGRGDEGRDHESTWGATPAAKEEWHSKNGDAVVRESEQLPKKENKR